LHFFSIHLTLHFLLCGHPAATAGVWCTYRPAPPLALVNVDVGHNNNRREEKRRLPVVVVELVPQKRVATVFRSKIRPPNIFVVLLPPKNRFYLLDNHPKSNEK
jgi:hypothetical protein